MVLIDSTQKVAAVRQGFDIRGSVMVGGEIQGGSMEAMELRANSFVEEREYENRRFQRRVLQARRRGGGTDGVDSARHYSHSSIWRGHYTERKERDD